MRKPFAIVVIVLLFVLSCALGWQSCQRRKAELRSSATLKSMYGDVQHLRLKNNEIAAEKLSAEVSASFYKTLLLQNKDSLKLLKERVGRLAAITNHMTVSATDTRVIQTVLHDTVIKHDTTLLKTQKFTYRDRYLNLAGMLFKDSVKIEYQAITNLDIVHYRKRKNIFSASYPVVNVVSDNPYLKVNGISDYAIVEDKKFYQTQAFAYGAGIITGLLINIINR